MVRVAALAAFLVGQGIQHGLAEAGTKLIQQNRARKVVPEKFQRFMDRICMGRWAQQFCCHADNPWHLLFMLGPMNLITVLFRYFIMGWGMTWHQMPLAIAITTHGLHCVLVIVVAGWGLDILYQPILPHPRASWLTFGSLLYGTTMLFHSLSVVAITVKMPVLPVRLFATPVVCFSFGALVRRLPHLSKNDPSCDNLSACNPPFVCRVFFTTAAVAASWGS